MNSQHKYSIVNPYTKEIVDNVYINTENEINNLLELSYKTKCKLSSIERANILKKTAKTLEQQKDDIAIIITKESGLCIKQSLYEVNRAINCFNQSAIQAELIEKIDLSKDFASSDSYGLPKLTVISEPWDLIIGITPFNHPLNMVAHKVGPAIASCTTMVIKPSEKTPLTALYLIDMLTKNGLPPNMVNIITGIPPQKIVEQLVTFPKLDIVTFTGSVEVGKYIARKMVNNGNELKKFIPELGDNSAFVVLNDADISIATRIALSAFDNSGQRCTSIKRILLQNDIADEFIEQFIELTKRLKYGDPMDKDIDIGCVINENAAVLIQERVNRAIEEGGRLIYGNIRNGALYCPTIIDNVRPSSELVVKETFGPVAPIIRIKDVYEAIKIIKSDNFRLAGAIATKNRQKAMELQNSICVGQFSWNGPPSYRTEEAPFGGFADSGNGEKEGIVMSVRAMRRIRTFYEHITIKE